MKENLKLREAVFNKIGWITHEIDFGYGLQKCWEMPDGNQYPEEILPPIETTWEVTAQYLVPFMQRKGFEYRILNYPDILGLGFFWTGQLELDPRHQWKKAEIKDDNLALAACEAFMEVEI